MLLVLCLLSLQTPWSSLRGPERSGRAPDVQLPTNFDLDRDRLWRRELDPGYSSPVLAGGGIFLTVNRDGRIYTLCVEASDGEVRWEHAGPEMDLAQAYDDDIKPALHAAATPVTDGEGLFVSFPEYGLVGYELSGRERWRLPLPPYRALYPGASSLALSNGRLVHLCDHDRESFLLAVDPEDGSVLWKTERPFATHGFSSPTILGDVVIVSGPHRVDAYELQTGRVLWWVDGLSWQPRATPVGGRGVVYVQSAVITVRKPGWQGVTAGWADALIAWDTDGDDCLDQVEIEPAEIPGEWSVHDLDRDGALDATEWNHLCARSRSGSGLWALRLGGVDDVSDSHVLWTRQRRVPLTATPLLMDGVLVLLRDGGIAIGLDADDGTELWQTRMDGMRSKIFSSPISIGGDVLSFSRDGALAILDPRDGRVLRTGDIGEGVWATPAVGARAFYVRTTQALHAFRLRGATADASLGTQAFVGVDVLTMSTAGMLRDQTIVVRNGVIHQLGPRDSTHLPEGTDVLAQGPGLTVAPGLIDAWTRVEDEYELLLHLRAGVTTIRNVDGRPGLLELRERVRSGQVLGPRWLIGAPSISRHLPLEEAVRAVELGDRSGYDFASAERGVSAEVWLAAVGRARELGVPFVGVVPEDLDLVEALERTPWTIDQLETIVAEPEFVKLLAHAHAPLTPLIASHSMQIQVQSHRTEWIRNDVAMRDLSPIVRQLWGPAAHMLHAVDRRSVDEQERSCRAQRDAIQALDEAGVLLLAGSDAITSFIHPGRGLHLELRAFAEAGLPAKRVLRTATTSPGRVLAPYVGATLGAVSTGASADLILIAGSPLDDLTLLEDPLGTMVRGRWFPRDELQAAIVEAREVYGAEAQFVGAVSRRRPPGLRGRRQLEGILAGDEMGALDVRQSTVRRMAELMGKPGMRRQAEAAVVQEFADHRWPAGATRSGER